MMLRNFFKLPYVLLLLIGSVFSVSGQMTTVNIAVDKDSYTCSQYPTTNYGTSSDLKVGTYKPTKLTLYYYRTFVHFDLSSVPAGKEIYSVKFGLRKSVANTGTPSYIVRRVESSWAENTITHGSQPAISSLTIDQSTSYTTTNDTVVFDVTTISRRMYWGLAANQGFCVMVVDETSAPHNSTFYSDESGTFDPYIEVKYYDPLAVINVDITHESAASAGDAEIDLDMTGGSGSYTYAWKNSAGTTISTDTILSSINYGLYHLEVTGSYGEKLYQSFLVGIECDTVSIHYQPDGNYTLNSYVSNAIVSGVDYKKENYANYGNVWANHKQMDGVYRQSESFLDFNVWMDNRFTVQQADMTLTGNGHTISAYRDNAAELLLVTGGWNENVITYNNQPTYTDSLTVEVPYTTSSTQSRTVDISSFWNHWKQDNTANYGMKFQLQDTVTDYYVGQTYYSPNTTSTATAYRPSVAFVLDLINSNPYHCFPGYARLQTTLSGATVQAELNYVYFFYDEEYDGDTLDYDVFAWDDVVSPILAGSSNIIPISYGRNEIKLDVSSLPEQASYILEVRNARRETYYLRFRK